jgi:hypothetical protein
MKSNQPMERNIPKQRIKRSGSSSVEIEASDYEKDITRETSKMREIKSPKSNKGSSQANQSSQHNLLDSQEAKAMVGKPEEELKFRNLLKEKLQVTNVPDLKLIT